MSIRQLRWSTSTSSFPGECSNSASLSGQFISSKTDNRPYYRNPKISDDSGVMLAKQAEKLDCSQFGRYYETTEQVLEIKYLWH
jgi:hypothetical protein